jgi:hypothetical protein
MEQEIWDWVPDYEWYYFISDYGRVRSRCKGRDICLMPDKDGYLRCHLYKRGIRKSFYVHFLVALTFLKKPEGNVQVHHKDGNRQNNHVENLEWVTKKQNLALRNFEDINVVDAESLKIIATCNNVSEASRFTNVSDIMIRKILGTKESVNGYRFEVGF